MARQKKLPTVVTDVDRCVNVLVAAAKARTKATPLAGSRQIPVPPSLEPLTRMAYSAVRLDQAGAEIIDLCRVLSSTREGAQNAVDERHRIDATAIRKGKIAPYTRVVRVEIRELPEE